jgi:hypothetical protein
MICPEIFTAIFPMICPEVFLAIPHAITAVNSPGISPARRRRLRFR